MSRTPEDTREAGFAEPMNRGERHQLTGVIGGPLLILVVLQVKYSLSQLWSCDSQAGLMVSHVVSLLALLLGMAVTLLAYRQWRGVGREFAGDLDGAEGRTRVMAAVGVGISGISTLIIFAMWLPLFIIDPCLH